MSDERERLFVGDNNLDDLRQMWQETNTPALHKRSSAKLRVLLDWALPKLIGEVKRCYEIMDEVILRAMDAREGEASDIIKHGDEEYVHVDEITYPFSKSDIDAALDSKASE